MHIAVGNNRNLSHQQIGYNSSGQFSYILSPINQQVLLHSYSLYNANSSTSDVGLGLALNNAKWNLLSIVSGVATDVSKLVQAGTAVQLFSTSNNDGFLVESSRLFGYVVFNVSQASTGSPVYTYQYWNGTSWATLTPLQTPVYSSTGYIYLAFNPPMDWAQGDGGLSSLGLYAIRVLATTAPTQAVKVTLTRVSKWLYYQQALPGGSRLAVDFEGRPLLLEGGEAIAPYFSTAYIQNTVEVSYQIAP